MLTLMIPMFEWIKPGHLHDPIESWLSYIIDHITRRGYVIASAQFFTSKCFAQFRPRQKHNLFSDRVNSDRESSMGYFVRFFMFCSVVSGLWKV